MLLILSIVLASIAVVFIYNNTKWLLQWSMQERVVAIAQTAALDFDEAELELITGPESVNTKIYEKIVKRLQAIKLANPNIRYAYIQKKTEDLDTVLFVADADSLHPDNPTDSNQNGVIDPDEELIFPGDEYDISEYPDFIQIAFIQPYVDNNPYVDEDEALSSDQWGTYLSATAPIKGDNYFAQYLFGIDVDVTDYIKLSNVALRPFLLFVSFLILLLTTQTVILVRMWGSRVKLLKELDRQKDELLSIVSHQLATPISAVKWNLEMMVDGDFGKMTKEQEMHLKTIQPQAENLADLASMILDVSRIQLGRMKVDRTDLDIGEFVEEVFNEVEPKAQEKKVKFTKSVSQKLPKAMLDKRLMRMAMENLLTNAVKYTPEGGTVELNVKVKGKNLYYEVKDNGCGIPKSEHDKIFGKLFRASNVSDTEGNGFGLYVAKGAVESQEGRIWFESTEKKGTTFFVELPIIEPKKKAK